MRIYLFLMLLLITSVILYRILNKKNESQIRNRVAYAHKINLSYYPVEGQTLDQLNSSMFERGPIGHSNRRYFAYTLWNIKLNQRKAGKNQHKLALSFAQAPNFQCYISMHLPFLRIRKGAYEDLQSEWEIFYNNMLIHESRHVRNAIYACRVLSRSVASNSRLLSISNRLKQRDKKYDQITKHGILEGVKLVSK